MDWVPKQAANPLPAGRYSLAIGGW